jgi:SAM-dependent methyltransferase
VSESGRQGRRGSARAGDASADDPRGPHRLFFDAWSLFYDTPTVQQLTYRPVHDAVVQALQADPPARILDVGCGTGKLALRLSHEFARSRVIGCDFSRGMLREARTRSATLALAQGDAQRLPFADASFDAVVSTEAFHWFPDPDAALAGFHRLLAPQGRLLIAFVNPPFEALSWASRTVSKWFGEPLRWPTPGALRRQIEAAGFAVTAQQRIFRLPAPVLLPPVLTQAVRRG